MWSKKKHRQKLTLVPSVLKTDLLGPGSEQYRIAAVFGRLVVPEKRSNPESKEIELAFMRLRSTAPHPGPPLIFLQGGPGASGIDALRWDLPWFTALQETGTRHLRKNYSSRMGVPAAREPFPAWSTGLPRATS